VSTIGIGVLIGVALGLRFKVLILIPVIVLAIVGAAVAGVARGDQMLSVALTMVIVATALQVGYLGGIVIRAVCRGISLPSGPTEVFMSKMLDIQDHMEVVGSDNNHVGTVDHRESDCIILSGDDPKAGGKPHLISADWVDYVDRKVHLNKPSNKALSEWLVVA
jgi:hypothetical protein